MKKKVLLHGLLVFSLLLSYSTVFAEEEIAGYYKVTDGIVTSNSIIYLLVFGLVVLLVTSLIPVSTFDRKPKSKFTDLSKKKLAVLLPGENVEKIKDVAYELFLKIEEAWMNFDYKTLEDNCVDYLYKEYQSQLKNMKARNEQNIVKDFKLFDYYLVDIETISDDTVLTIIFDVNYDDYIIDTKTKEIVKGKNRKNRTVYYECKFIYSGSSKSMIKCPKCGAKLDKKNKGKCKRCGNDIDSVNTKLKLSRKRIVK